MKLILKLIASAPCLAFVSASLAWDCDTDCNKVACTQVCLPILGCNQVCEPTTLSSCEFEKHASCIAKNVPIDKIVKTVGGATVLLGPAGTAISLIVVDQTAESVEKARRTFPPVTIPPTAPSGSGISYSAQSDCVLNVISSPSSNYVVFYAEPDIFDKIKINDNLLASSKNPTDSCGLGGGMTPVAKGEGLIQQIVTQTITVNGQQQAAYFVLINKW